MIFCVCVVVKIQFRLIFLFMEGEATYLFNGMDDLGIWVNFFLTKAQATS